MAVNTRLKRAVFVLFPGYELLDVFGPMEFFTAVQRVLQKENEGYIVDVISEPKGPVSCNSGPTCAFGDKDINDYLRSLGNNKLDLLVIPGGGGTRTLVNDQELLSRLRLICAKSETIASVCTGSALLAKAGILDGLRATSNKMSFGWVASQSSKVHWKPKARWVVDKNIWTSSGVAAGMDMALALIARYFGDDIASQTAKRLEYVWNKDSEHDLFEAKL